jgi:predicted permease
METLWKDLHFAWMTLRRSPSFTFVAVFVLVLGIAATTAVTSVVSAVLLHDLPYPDPGRLVLLEGFKDEKGSLETFPSSYLDYKDWKTRSRSFADMGVHSPAQAFNLLTEGEPERVDGEVVDSSYFQLLRVRPILGRTFTAQDDGRPGEPRIVVLSHRLWQRRFGSDRGAIGRSLIVDGESYQIAGVMPAGFQGLTDEADLWLPLTMSNEIMGNSRFLNRRGVRWLVAVARLLPGVTVAQAQREMDVVNAALGREFADTNEQMVVRVKTLSDSLFGDLRFPLLTLLGAALFVLMIAWTTVANLLLARATARQREMAIRSALGATRWRQIRQLLTESLLLAAISGALGLLLAYWTTGLLVAASAIRFQSFVGLGLDPLVVAAVLALSLACGVTFGLAPAWFGLRAGTGALREGSSSTGVARLRFQSSLVVAEIALALFLLIGAGLMIKGFRRFRQTDLGFEPRNLLTVRVDLKGKQFADLKTMAQLARLYRQRLRTLPGIRSAAVEGPTMPTDGWFGSSFIVEDLLAKTKDGVAYMVFHNVSPGFFRDLGIPIIQGREFTEADNETSLPAIVISQAMVRKYWPGENPLGKRMRFGKRDPNAPWLTVVGVVGDLNQHAMQEVEWPGPDVYFAIQQFPPLLVPRFTFLIRAAAGVAPSSLASRVESELRAVAPTLPPYDVDSMEHRLDEFAAKGHFLVLLMGLFAGLALVLAAAGLYGVLFYSVTQRTREMGIRVALGASSADLVSLVFGRAAALSAAGLGIGLCAAVALNRLFESLLYGVSPTDRLTLLSTSTLLFLVAMAASYFPARRALRVPPTIALRME